MYDGVEKTKADFPGDGSQLAAGTSGYYRAAAESLEQGGSLYLVGRVAGSYLLDTIASIQTVS